MAPTPHPTSAIAESVNATFVRVMLPTALSSNTPNTTSVILSMVAQKSRSPVDRGRSEGAIASSNAAPGRKSTSGTVNSVVITVTGTNTHTVAATTAAPAHQAVLCPLSALMSLLKRFK